MDGSGIVVVSGPPCAGKSTYIDENRAPQDLIVDMDRIAHALGYPTPQIDYNTDHPARQLALAVRASILKRLPTRDATAWIVATWPDLGYWERRGVHVIQLDPGADECHRRADEIGRASSTHQQIDQWYAEHGPTRAW